MRCLRCATDGPPGARFCAICGARLSAPAAPPEGERRQISVLFCDLVGSTAHAEQLDPEELLDVLREYQRTCVEAVERFEGHVAQYLGDGVLAYFGYPLAHEDDPRRAVLAGLAILESLERLNERNAPSGRRPLAARIGIHTGPVVTGEVGAGDRRETLALGQTPNLAARLQAAAEPNTIVVSDATHRLVERFFAFQDLGRHALKGLSTPERIFRVSGRVSPASRFEATVTGGLTPFISRETEMARLEEAWAAALAGSGRVLVLEGDAGVGKSRLVRRLEAVAVERSGTGVTAWFCSPYHSNSALFPVIDALERALDLPHARGPDERLARLQALVAHRNLPEHPGAPLLADLLSIPRGDRYPALGLTPERQKQETLAILARLVLDPASDRPALLIVEDLHWADPTTLELLGQLVAQARRSRLLALVTTRSGLRTSWSDSAPPERLTVSGLPPAAVRELVRSVAHGKRLPPEIVERISEVTDGVPLYVEEFTRTVLESDALTEWEDRFEMHGALPPGAIPSTLRDSLTARLDRLGPARGIAQHAAVIGRRFDTALLATVSPESGTVLDEGLARLLETGLVYRINTPSGAEYEFKHALVHAAAYESLLRRTRQQLHARLGKALEERFLEGAPIQPDLLAYHWSEAQDWTRAIDYWLLAGRRSLVRSANREAIAHLRAGLGRLPHLRTDSERDAVELRLLTTLGPALIATTGFASSEVGEVYARARALCAMLDDQPEFFPALWGSWVFHLVRGELQVARGFAEQMLRLGEQTGDSAMLVEARWTLADALYWLGDLRSADGHLRAAAEIYDPARHRANALLYGQDPGVATECYRAYVQWMLGYPDRAVEALERARALAAACDHPFTSGWALAFRFMVHMFRQEPEAAADAAERTIAFCTEQSHPFWLAAAVIVRGWARAQTGDREAGIAQMREGIALYETIGSVVVQPLWLGLLASTLLDAGRVGEAREALDRGFARARQSAERISEIDLWRIRGELLARESPADLDGPQASFEQALALATRCEARSLGLRAATALHRLLASRGGAALAGSPLPAILASFTEGLDTRDLVAAREALQPPDPAPRWSVPTP
jgi:predicted ATPase/class 3 adenylate cyclase